MGPAAGLSRGPAGAPPRDIAGGPPRLDRAAGLRGLDRGGRGNFGGAEGRAASTSGNSYTRNSYSGSGYGRDYRYGAYAAGAAGAAAGYAYGSNSASSDDGCYYVSESTRYGTRRVLVCKGN
jgi:hypothetical protein